MKALLLTSLFAGTVLLSGCVVSIGGDKEDGYSYSSGSSWEKREERNREFVATTETGVSKQMVVEKLGAADFNEMVGNGNGDDVHVLYYRTQRVDDDGVTTKNECTPLVFVNNKLVGWGELSLSKYL